MRIIAALALVFASTEAIALKEECPVVVMDTNFTTSTVDDMSCHCFGEMVNKSQWKDATIAEIQAHPHKSYAEVIKDTAPSIPVEIRNAIGGKLEKCPLGNI